MSQLNADPSLRRQLLEQLTPNLELTADQLRARTLHVLGEALTAIEAKKFSGDLHYAATALGFALAGCEEHAAHATRQLLAPFRLAPPAVAPTSGRLLEAIARLLQRPVDDR